MVARKLTEDVLLDLFLLYEDKSNDFTIKYLADKVGISRSRLGKLFKRINREKLRINYETTSKYLLPLKEYLEGKSITEIAHKYGVSRTTLYSNFERLTNGK